MLKPLQRWSECAQDAYRIAYWSRVDYHTPLHQLILRRQVQTAPHAVGTSTSGQAYGAMWPSLVRMWKEEGFRGFMKGNGINVVRVSLLINCTRKWSSMQLLNSHR